MEVSDTLGKNAVAKRRSRFFENSEKKAKRAEREAEPREAESGARHDEMRQYSRAQLLEVILLQSKENESLKTEIQRLQSELTDRALKLSRAGDIAEASLALSNIFKAAEEAVSQYKENIRRLSEDHEAIAGNIVKEAEEKARAIVIEAEQMASRRLNEAEKAANALTAKAQVSAARSKLDADKYWNDLSAKLEELYNQKRGIRELAEMDEDEQ